MIGWTMAFEECAHLPTYAQRAAVATPNLSIVATTRIGLSVRNKLLFRGSGLA